MTESILFIVCLSMFWFFTRPLSMSTTSASSSAIIYLMFIVVRLIEAALWLKTLILSNVSNHLRLVSESYTLIHMVFHKVSRSTTFIVSFIIPPVIHYQIILIILIKLELKSKSIELVLGSKLDLLVVVVTEESPIDLVSVVADAMRKGSWIVFDLFIGILFIPQWRGWWGSTVNCKTSLYVLGVSQASNLHMLMLHLYNLL